MTEPVDTNALRELLEKATPGPWCQHFNGTFSFLFDVDSRDVKLCDEHHAFAWVDGWAGELAERYPMPPNVKRYLTKIRHEYGRRG